MGSAAHHLRQICPNAAIGVADQHRGFRSDQAANALCAIRRGDSLVDQNEAGGVTRSRNDGRCQAVEHVVPLRDGFRLDLADRILAQPDTLHESVANEACAVGGAPTHPQNAMQVPVTQLDTDCLRRGASDLLQHVLRRGAIGWSRVAGEAPDARIGRDLFGFSTQTALGILHQSNESVSGASDARRRGGEQDSLERPICDERKDCKGQDEQRGDQRGELYGNRLVTRKSEQRTDYRVRGVSTQIKRVGNHTVTEDAKEMSISYHALSFSYHFGGKPLESRVNFSGIQTGRRASAELVDW
jgi:hypothetical protein